MPTPTCRPRYLADEHFSGDFYLTQIVSHHDRPALDRFRTAVDRRGVDLPGVFGLFYYRSANPKTLTTLRHFLPVPVEGLTKEFAEGASPENSSARDRSMRCAPPVSSIAMCRTCRWDRARQTLEKILSSLGTCRGYRHIPQTDSPNSPRTQTPQSPAGFSAPSPRRGERVSSAPRDRRRGRWP